MEEDLAEEGLAVGTELGKYRLLRPMGAGGMALVWEAEHGKLGQRVAIKVLRKKLCADHTLVERFEREGRALSKLKSRHVVRVLDVDETPSGAPYLVMELLSGVDLEREIERRGALPIEEAGGYVLQACRALAEAHAVGIVHRDIKPANLFLADESGERVLKVLDFGIAKDAPPEGESRLTQSLAVIGTPLYMSPEQFRGTRDVDARSDVWALGATLYELIAGRPPFVGSATTVGIAIVADPTPPVRSHRADVPDAIVQVLDRCLAKDPSERYADATELGQALAGVLPSATFALPSRTSLSGSSTGAMRADHAEIVGAPTELSVASPTAPAVTSARPAAEPPTPKPARAGWIAIAAVAVLGLVAGGVVLTRSPAAPVDSAAAVASSGPTIGTRGAETSAGSASATKSVTAIPSAPEPSAPSSGRASANPAPEEPRTPRATEAAAASAPRATPKASASTHNASSPPSSPSQPPLFIP